MPLYAKGTLKPIAVPTSVELKTLISELNGIAPLKNSPALLVVSDCATNVSC